MPSAITPCSLRSSVSSCCGTHTHTDTASSHTYHHQYTCSSVSSCCGTHTHTDTASSHTYHHQYTCSSVSSCCGTHTHTDTASSHTYHHQYTCSSVSSCCGTHTHTDTASSHTYHHQYTCSSVSSCCGAHTHRHCIITHLSPSIHLQLHLQLLWRTHTQTLHHHTPITINTPAAPSPVAVAHTHTQTLHHHTPITINTPAALSPVAVAHTHTQTLHHHTPITINTPAAPSPVAVAHKHTDTASSHTYHHQYTCSSVSSCCGTHTQTLHHHTPITINTPAALSPVAVAHTHRHCIITHLSPSIHLQLRLQLLWHTPTDTASSHTYHHQYTCSSVPSCCGTHTQTLHHHTPITINTPAACADVSSCCGMHTHTQTLHHHTPITINTSAWDNPWDHYTYHNQHTCMC